ncbi:MAG: hypothetical protein K2Q22_16565 [Cytophagales bacterium]|nr:hypothetical protein [Cytophagales bacterium]
MNIFDPYINSLLTAFNSQNVEYIIVGGYAVNYHGYIRTTGDIDLWLRPSNENKQNIIAAFREIGVTEETLESLQSADFTKHLHFIDGKAPFKIDFINFVSAVSFEEAWPKRIIAKFDGLELPFIQYDQLILTKITSDRLKDKLDIEELQKIHNLRK